MNIFKASYETNSYLNVNENIKLNFECDDNDVIWKSLNPNIAIVSNGIVTGINPGHTDIQVLKDDECIYSFGITVLNCNHNNLLNALLKAHNSNIFVRKDLKIDGNKPFNYDVFESVSKYLFAPLEINKDYLEKGNNKWKKLTNEYLSSVEFITVHYTANNNETANALAHARYFVNEDQPTSIHYNTGNDGVYMCLDNDKRAAHAGDSSGPVFKWIDTGIIYDGCDLNDIKVDVSEDFYYVINNKKTNIKLPDTYKYNDRNTKHIYCDKGLINIENTNVYKKPSDLFNKMGFAFCVKDNHYFMSQTWWCYQQKLEGAICNVGGNRNSIGIESCVNFESDLWYTWQITAKLVAKLMRDNNLDLSRVKGHHFYTAKNCPQPMLENNLEIWNKFLELVSIEYNMINYIENFEINFIPLNSNIDNKGRIIEYQENKCIKYKIEIIDKVNGNKESLILTSIM